MKFIVSSTELLSLIMSTARVIKSSKHESVENDIIQNNRKNPYTYLSNSLFNEVYKEYNFLLKQLIPDDEKLHISKYKKKKESIFRLQNDIFKSTACNLIESTVAKPQARILDFKSFISGSTKALLRRMALYTGQVQSTLFRVLRNTRIHSLSIFFGLCCSCSGYIFEAITGASSHPVPANN